MLNYFRKILLYSNYKDELSYDVEIDTEKFESIPKDIETTENKLKDLFKDANDFVIKKITMSEDINLMIVYIDGIISNEILDLDILKPLMIDSKNIKTINNKSLINILKERLISVGDIDTTDNFIKSIDSILVGNVVIFINGFDVSLTVNSKGWESRGVAEPETEAVVRGPREGFTESLRTNTSLMRRKIKTHNLKFETIKLGKYSKTDVCICYIKDLVNEEVLKEVRKRIKRINIDAILESGYIEAFIEDEPYSIFPTVGNSEKPDVVAGKLLEGRVAIFCDGTPFALTVPFLLIESIHASEDYYSRTYFASLVRFARVIALFLTTLLPSFYVALISFHADVIPFKLLLNITSSREGLPFSAFSEALFMSLSFELLREAGIRMPRPIGQAVSIVGALILGEAAVKAGIASNLMIMVTALTAISSFLIPPMGGSVPILRILFLFPANILGFLGVFISIFMLLIHLCSIESFKISYLSPFTPIDINGLKDSVIRLPLYVLTKRPKYLINRFNFKNRYRLKPRK